MHFGERFAEGYKQLQRITLQTGTAEVDGSAWVDIGTFRRFVAKASVGTIVATGTFDFRVRQAKDASGTGAKALIAATQLPDTGDDKDLWLEFKAEDLDVKNGFHFVRLECIPATANVTFFAELLAFIAEYQPVTQPANVVATYLVAS